ncbi:MAG: TadE/TadG family type IV pilus assembly protein [Micavibrio sp.]
MIRAIKSYLFENRGIAAVEFALVVPILFTLMVGALDFGSFMNMQMRLENLSRSVAEYLLQGGEEDNAWEDVIVSSGHFGNTEDLESRMTLTIAQVCVCDDGEDMSCDNDCGTGEYKRHFFEVDIEMNYSPILPTLGIADNLVTRGSTRLQSE